MRVLVTTVVHHPHDARILHRQARALHDAGHQVVLAAPFGAYDVAPPPWVEPVDLPRASGRRRWRALRAARAAIERLSSSVDLVLLHDPELVLAVAGEEHRLPPLVWDVHEDTASAFTLKGWLPAPARPVARTAVHRVERSAERRMHLILAEHAYARRFVGRHPVVPNSTTVPSVVPAPGIDRVVYLGALSTARGAADLVEVARRLHREGVRTELIGGADPQTRPLLERAVDAGTLDWDGFVPNDRAVRRIEGALAGLSLLRDEPNYRHSMPTKVVEYMAHGIPSVTTPLPLAAAMVREHGCGVVVPFERPGSVVKAVLALRDDAGWRAEAGRRGHRAALRHHHWPDSAPAFVAYLEHCAGIRPTGSAPAPLDDIIGLRRAS